MAWSGGTNPEQVSQVLKFSSTQGAHVFKFNTYFPKKIICF